MLLQIALLLLIQADSVQETTPPEAPPPQRSQVMDSPNQYVGLTTIGWNPMVGDGFYGDWPWGSDGLTGGWGGVRNDLEKHGIQVFGEYTSFLQENFTGGLGTGLTPPKKYPPRRLIRKTRTR